MKMSKKSITLILSIICLLVNITGCSKNLDDLPDFEFDDNFSADVHRNQVHRPPTIDFSDFDDFFIDDGNNEQDHELDIKSKEKLLKNAILRALSTKELKYKFSEVLPLLRHLSKAQKMVFSSIISAQINGRRSFTFNEVSTHSIKSNEK